MTGTESPGLGLFEGIGIEIEYAIVDRDSLAVRPVADRVLETLAGEPSNEAELGEIVASNELVLHVLELKTSGPVKALDGVARMFGSGIARTNEALSSLGARLMPTAMHPFMDPAQETRLWPHEQNDIYETFNALFDCRGHGWSNLQSIHINLPFQGDSEFARLHAAVRLVLPILPALAASSPIVEGRVTGLADNRLEYYRHNADRIPSVAGRIIPEPVFSQSEYENGILAAIARDIAPHDPNGVLEPEWTNSRGAIARFVRDSIEIRLVDTQESPAADLAVADAVVRTVRALAEERWLSTAEQRAWGVAPLDDPFLAAIREGDTAVITDEAYLRVFGVTSSQLSMRELWAHLVEELVPTGSDARAALEHIVRRGCLARRIVERVGAQPAAGRIREVYRDLCDCLAENRPFS